MRTKILSAAIEVFGAKGPYQPVVADFVKSAGIARGTFYYYFRTVDELRKEAIDFAMSTFVTSIQAYIQDIDNPVMRLATGLRIFLAKANADPAFAAFVGSTPEVPDRVNEYSRVQMKRAIEQQIVRVRTTESAIMLANAIMQYGAMSRRLHRRAGWNDTKIIRAILIAWGVSEELIARTLTVPLPKLPRPR